MILLKNCRIIIDIKANTETVKDILLDDGKIVKIEDEIDEKLIINQSKKNSNNGQCEIIDVNKNYVIPGLIDPHVHFREPGLTHKEDFFSGSVAAAAGGITTFLDMPNTIPPTTSLDLLESKRKLAQKSLVNFGFHFGAATDNLDQIKKVKNVASTKVFLNISTGKLKIEDDKILKEIFMNSKIVSVHAEGEMVNKAIELSKECGNKLYLCHISQRSELDYIKENKTDKMFVEITPHHLFLSEEEDHDSFTKMLPSLKSVMDRESIFTAVNEGLVDTIGTDHAPHTIGEKLDKNFPHGVPGVETMLPLLLNAINLEEITLGRIIELCSENPAKIFGIKNKGFIKVGYDADLTIIDLELRKEVNEDMLLTRCGWSPFSGRVLVGWPILTIVNGNVVFDNGEIYSENKGREVEFE